MRIGIDLTWLKPKKSGGVEFYAKNLLDGILKLKDKNEYVLLLAQDNSEYLRDYFGNDERLIYIDCKTNANAVAQHLFWQSTREYSILKKNNVKFCFFPVYEMPIYKNKNIKCVTVIHDMQADNYPEYFKKYELVWFHMAWQRVLDNSEKVIVTTNYTKQDVEKRYKSHGNIEVIYIPITLQAPVNESFDSLSEKYSIKDHEYFYTVSSMLPHKNLITLLKMMKKISEESISLPKKLVISGVGGRNKENFLSQIYKLGIQDSIVMTDFVSNEERNLLIQHSNVFLFSSIFEGFGMPPIEAMMLGAKVLSTKKTSLEEVTMDRCTYVDDPFDIDEWIRKLVKMQNQTSKVILFDEYKDTVIARQYLNLFYEMNKD
jgi:glycosyltransferase involved in cell wall biosynthesis